MAQEALFLVAKCMTFHIAEAVYNAAGNKFQKLGCRNNRLKQVKPTTRETDTLVSFC